MFKDINVDLDTSDYMDYAQKRLMILKSSKALFAKGLNDNHDDREGGSDADEEWASVRCDVMSRSTTTISCPSLYPFSYIVKNPIIIFLALLFPCEQLRVNERKAGRG